VADVQRAGAGLCNDGAVWKLALEGPNMVRELLLDDSDDSKFANVPFDRKPDGSLSCCLKRPTLRLGSSITLVILGKPLQIILLSPQ